MTEETYKVDQGGLMRCCLQTLDDLMLLRKRAHELLMPEGDVITCAYCKGKMICSGASWRWLPNAPREIQL